MGPALETFLGMALLIGLMLAGVVMLTRPFWPRIANYFRRWHERDTQLEQRQREEADCRARARQEVGELCHDDLRGPQASALPHTVSVQEAGKVLEQTPEKAAEQPAVQRLKV